MTATALHQVPPLEQHTEHPHITRVEGVALLRGTRLAVRLIAQQYRAGDSVDDILHTYPHLSATAVHDAISYYLDHRAEIEQEIAANRLEYVLTQTGAQLNECGFVSSPAAEHE
ncbi:MAG: DUF433 domain-containing protein [Chloroflexi bacterium]|nr:DUF433 domain-containing protein [Chloroflexota bacterium]